jgi:hypothetical protein
MIAKEIKKILCYYVTVKKNMADFIFLNTIETERRVYINSRSN